MLSQENADFHCLLGDARRLFGLHRDAINDILVATFDEVQDIADNLNVEVNKERDLLEIMEKANRALSQISDRISAYHDLRGKYRFPLLKP